MRWRMIQFRSIGQIDDGYLVPVESGQDVPFDIKRVYYIHDVGSGITRGRHAHCDLHQVAVCVKGTCRFYLDDGNTSEYVNLNCPDQGLYIGPMTWREMDRFSADCVLMVFASAHYDESDYVNSYQEFVDRVMASRGGV